MPTSHFPLVLYIPHPKTPPYPSAAINPFPAPNMGTLVLTLQLQPELEFPANPWSNWLVIGTGFPCRWRPQPRIFAFWGNLLVGAILRKVLPNHDSRPGYT